MNLAAADLFLVSVPHPAFLIIMKGIPLKSGVTQVSKPNTATVVAKSSYILTFYARAPPTSTDLSPSRRVHCLLDPTQMTLASPCQDAFVGTLRVCARLWACLVSGMVRAEELKADREHGTLQETEAFDSRDSASARTTCQGAHNSVPVSTFFGSPLRNGAGMRLGGDCAICR